MPQPASCVADPAERCVADPAERRAADPAARPRVAESIDWTMSGADVKRGLLLFEALDADSDGFVVKDDFLKHLPESAPAAIARRLISKPGGASAFDANALLFKTADVGADGKLSDVELLVLFRASVYIGGDDNKLPPLPPTDADVGVIRVAIDKCNMKELLDAEGNSPIHVAAKVGVVPKLSLFLDGGFNPNARNRLSERPLHLAAIEGHLGAVRVLLASGANAKSMDSSSRSPLDCALLAGKSAKIEAALCDAGGTSSWWEAEQVRRARTAEGVKAMKAAEAARAAQAEIDAKFRNVAAELQQSSIAGVRQRRAEIVAARAAADAIRYNKLFVLLLCNLYIEFVNRNSECCIRNDFITCRNFICIPSNLIVLFIFFLLDAVIIVIHTLLVIPWTLCVWLRRACEPGPESRLSPSDREKLKREDAVASAAEAVPAHV